MKQYDILIVDDDYKNSGAIIESFENYSLPYNIILANNGEQGLKLAFKLIPDLILLDWVMPDITGIEVLRQLKRNGSTKDIPVIVVSGIMVESEHLKSALDTGAFDYLRKPFNEIELIARVQATLRFIETNNKLVEQKKQIEILKAEQLEYDLDLKKQELLSSELEMFRSNEATTKLIDTLDNIVENQKNIDANQIKQLINSFKISQNETGWDALKLRLNQVHTGFSERLTKNYPDLTPREIQLCSFLRLNLSSKEIASITFQKEQSVKQARFRLRKKLNISTETNLISFIAKI